MNTVVEKSPDVNELYFCHGMCVYVRACIHVALHGRPGNEASIHIVQWDILNRTLILQSQNKQYLGHLTEQDTLTALSGLICHVHLSQLIFL